MRLNFRTLLLSLSLNVIIAACLATSTAADQWLQWRGPDRAAHSSSVDLLDDWEEQPPRLLWTGEGCGSGYAGVSMAGGRIYTMGDIDEQQHVVCMNADDGALLWTSPICDASDHDYPGSRCTPTIDGDRLVVVTSNGVIASLNIDDGEIVWSHDFKEKWDGQMMSRWGFAESPLVDGEVVLCTPGGPEAMMVALNKHTGEEIWRSAPTETGPEGRAGAGYSSIVISHGAGVKQYVQLTGRGLIGVAAEDGRYLWGYNDIANTTANIPTPIISGDHVFCTTGYGAGAALLRLVARGSGVEAEEVYFLESRTLQNHHGGMILLDGYLYGGHGNNKGFPICVRLSDGEVQWGSDIRGEGSGSAAVSYADGHFYFRYQSGEIALIEATPEEYRLAGTFTPEIVESPSWSHPVIVDQRLYLREQNSLMCYDIQKE